MTNEVYLPMEYLLMCEAIPAIVVLFIFPPLILQHHNNKCAHSAASLYSTE